MTCVTVGAAATLVCGGIGAVLGIMIGEAIEKWWSNR